MTKRTKTISEERYKELVSMDKMDHFKARAAMIEEAPADYKYGYGIYGSPVVVAMDGKFYIEYTTGDSCD